MKYPMTNPDFLIKLTHVFQVLMDPQVGLSENRVYSQTNSHLIGIMISKTIGDKGTLFSDTPTLQ
jgi:hypothetical protein